MAYWMCTACGHCATGATPPKECPHCGKTCCFGDVTCYRPECGGEQNTDPLLTSALRRGCPKGAKMVSGASKPVISESVVMPRPPLRGPEW
ncbi:MAG: hypothetical protein HYX90_01975 [Chloroflexi bacterium]|nr:hypothetical protein [Chloroflexota bacterium]